MKRIDKNTVELDPIELDVKRVFDLILDEGVDTPTAARYVLATHPKATKAFVEYLSEGTMTKTKGAVVPVDAA